MTNSMQRWQLMGAGRQHLELSRAPVPQPQRGEVLVRVSAVSLNFRDHLITQGLYAPNMPLPLTPGSDMAGVVEAVGGGVQRFTAGDRVMGSFTGDWLDGAPVAGQPVLGGVGGGPGVLAQYVVLPESWLVGSPASLDDAGAATLPCAALTAWNALFDLGGLAPGQTVLLQGTGGVSLFALQLARGAGAQVIITSSSERKLAQAAALGATHGIMRDAGGEWAQKALALTGGRGVDHVLELAAGDNLKHSLAALKPGGRISLIGVFDGFEARAPLMPMFQKQATIQGIFIGSRNGLDRLARAVDALQLKPVIDRRYAFGELPQALAHVERGAFGKVVIELPR